MVSSQGGCELDVVRTSPADCNQFYNQKVSETTQEILSLNQFYDYDDVRKMRSPSST
ncbi:MAG: hypothetical protein M3O33_13460 [Cyanobacteriota bacterium]|nr:hypothetical protein [Cyanobacteriota bacterium]